MHSDDAITFQVYSVMHSQSALRTTLSIIASFESTTLKQAVKHAVLGKHFISGHSDCRDFSLVETLAR